jgi:hypothetical protein
MSTNDNGLDLTQSSPFYENDETTALDNTGAVSGSITIADPSTSASSLSYSNGTTYTLGAGLTGTGINFPNSVWTTSSDYSWQNKASGKIQLDGDDADIEVNGRSLMQCIDAIEQRLNILVPNPELESEWAELKKLGDRYRKLEKKIQDKMATWDRLKAMPKINID